MIEADDGETVISLFYLKVYPPSLELDLFLVYSIVP